MRSWRSSRSASFCSTNDGPEPVTTSLRNRFSNEQNRASSPHSQRASSRLVRIERSPFASRTQSSMERVAWPTCSPESHSMYSTYSTICSGRAVFSPDNRNIRSMSENGASSPRP